MSFTRSTYVYVTARKAVVVGAVIGAVFVLAGCSSGMSSAAPPINYSAGELSGVDPDFEENMETCLSEAGYDVTIASDGGVQVKIPGDQLSAYDEASATCAAEFGYENPPAQTVEQKKALYQGLLALAGCLNDQGYSITNIPSEQAFEDGAVFDPYGEILVPASNAPSNDEYAKLLEKCPMP